MMKLHKKGFFDFMNDNCSVNTEPDIGKPASGGHIFLIGFMGAGKSTVARQLKRQKGLDIVEMDQMLFSRSGRS